MLESWSTAITTLQTQLALMAAGSGSPFAGMKVVLFQNNLQPNNTSTWANFTEATFDGYAAVSATGGGTAYIGADGFVHVTYASVQFTATDGLVTQTIYGWGLTNTAKTIWVGGNLLPAPVPITTAGDGIIIVPDLVYGQ